MHPAVTDRRTKCRGFTLIELLIVIAIIGVLAAVLLPRLLETRQTADEAKTFATMLRLSQGAEAFQRAHGYYPTDDLRMLEKTDKPAWKPDNGKNTGIESLVCMLSQSKKDGMDLGDLADQFVNTDGDDHGAELPMLHRHDRLEIGDAWGTPLVYFSKLGMERSQQVVPGGGESAVAVGAKKRPDGVFHGAGKFQFLSAGKDLAFGTADDLVFPDN